MSDLRATSGEGARRIERTKEVFDRHPVMSLAFCDAEGPWVVKAVFVEDEPDAGRLDICCVLIATPRKAAAIERGATVAFVVGGDGGDRWVQGTGTLEPVRDDGESAVIRKRLGERTPDAAPFVEHQDARCVRIRVDRLRLTDLGNDPPIAEFAFA